MKTTAALAAALAFSHPLSAQDQAPPKRPWSDKAALSYVAASGNATSQSLGFSNEYKYAWSGATLAFNTGGVRVAATAVNRSAFGTSLAGATVQETETTTTSTQSYYANLRFDHRLSERFQWFGSTGWERNLPAGLEARYTGILGIGYWWIKGDRTRLFSDAGAGYTRETLVLRPAGTQDRFGTYRFSAKLEQKVYASSQFTTELGVTNSFSDARNYLAVWRSAFNTTLNSHLALKVGYDLTYKNKPAFVGVDVVQTPVSTPPVILGQIPVQLRKTDAVFTTSLVITF